ncbi:uncharacterized protein LY79DRAFT_577248 [Colletotrichum navitas]|uniref:Transmembrane protein n=1 Tax=Colletotrichum navitas TaxID=681940 RepID=A0AAD8V9E4_9PEZI|nr:uncharacterized protein LY79DRAFT_577248 [Colletotrichum navitas]KAK1596706.1 hypothetical protein LY79DRAFT_577248 [Colletotrichum navitas]
MSMKERVILGWSRESVLAGVGVGGGAVVRLLSTYLPTLCKAAKIRASFEMERHRLPNNSDSKRTYVYVRPFTAQATRRSPQGALGAHTKSTLPTARRRSSRRMEAHRIALAASLAPVPFLLLFVLHSFFHVVGIVVQVLIGVGSHHRLHGFPRGSDKSVKKRK